MTNIILDTVFHRKKQIILLNFKYNYQLAQITKQLPNVTWSKTYNTWYVPFSREVFIQIKKRFEGIANIDAKILFNKIKELKNKQPFIKSKTLNTEVVSEIKNFKLWLLSRRYSNSTIATYTNALESFLKYYNYKALNEISNDDIIKYNNEYILANNLSTSFQNQIVNAIKLFFQTIQNTTINVELIHRPKRQKTLPNVLSKDEVKRILEAPKYLKHKAMLSLIYSCGLRCGELLRLRSRDIDSKRNILIIKQSKGRKDRIAPLSNKTINMLRDYFKVFKPKVYLFEGQIPGNSYDERSLQNVLKQSVIKAGINKPVTLHWLRHSYATHLLENGTDLRYIQEILGHSSSKTTEIYTHVSTRNIQNITSPFDLL